MRIWIKGGRLVDPASGREEQGDLFLEAGKIAALADPSGTGKAPDTIIDAGGCLVLPGLVDMHVHLRDPGQTYKEDLETGSRAAARGGFTTVVAMPNTDPVIDSPQNLVYVKEKAARVSPIHILQAGSMTKGQKGKELSDIPGMAAAGLTALSEDGKSVMDAALCRDAMKMAAQYHLPFLDHCEDIGLRGDGCMNDDQNARRLGLPGISNSVEDVITARDMILAAQTGAQLHLCHVSTRGAVKMLRFARKEGLAGISAEVCPHHLLLSSDDIKEDDGNYKMNPPLRTKEDVLALREGLQEGLIQVISTDHAPHGAAEKEVSMKEAAFGIVGLETALPLIYTYLVEPGIISLSRMVEVMSRNPARLLGLECGTLCPGSPADVIVVDVKETYRIDRSAFVSKGRNTPFQGWEVRGKVLYTICGGNIVYDSRGASYREYGEEDKR